MRFRFYARRSKSGFSLLETLVAMAAASIVLVTVYTISTQLLQRQLRAEQDLEFAQVARALLDEYVVTYPRLVTTGTYKQTWDWQIRETDYIPEHKTEHDHLFRFVEITAEIKPAGSTAAPYIASTIVARRAPGI